MDEQSGKKKRRRDLIWLAALIVYILAGIKSVPFHGDESTTLWMSRDYAYLFINHEPARVTYRDPPVNATEQHMRLITGSLTKYLMGVTWHFAGYTADDINEQWDWGADWHYNQNTGHAPDEKLLLLGRLPSALMFAAGVVVLFAIGMQFKSRFVAYGATLFYALHPALLLNGRRAMFEGGLVLFSLLTVWAGVRLLHRRDTSSMLLLGIISGLAISAKHTALFTVIPVFMAVGVYALAELSGRVAELSLMRRFAPQPTHTGRGLIIRMAITGLLALSVFYMLHPVWWGDPFTRAGQVYEARKGILDGQVAAFGGYDNRIDQFAGFVRQAFTGSPQYYEAPDWGNYITDQIDAYDGSLLRGLSIGELLPGRLLLVAFTLMGVWALWQQIKTSSAAWVVGLWGVFVLAASALTTPLEWQRYYLMCYPVIGLWAAQGAAWLIEPVPVRPKDRVRLDSA